MSQEKAQLIAPIGIMTVSGMTATGVITASSFTGNVVGSAKSLVNGTDVTAGVVTGTSFVGNLTGNIQRLADSAPNINVGVTTATSFVGNLTGSVTDLTSAPAITVGMVTATTLEGPVTGNVTGNVSGLAGGLGVNYNGGWTGAGTSQIKAGVVTATTLYGDGSNLDGVTSGPVSQQSIGITSAATSIDLSNGNLIHATQSANTTVSFASSTNGNVYFIRVKDNNTTARTITWPDSINWEGGTAPTLISNSTSGDAQVFLLVTRNMGVTWYGKEVVNYDLATPYYWFRWAGSNNDNWAGLLGHNQNHNVSYSSPTQIPGEWTGAVGRLAAKQDGTLWGLNKAGSGQLGNNSTSPGYYSSPTQVGDSTDWAPTSDKFVGTVYNSIAIKQDGSIWSWGSGQGGELGLNSLVRYSSPTQIGTSTDWNTVTGSKGTGDGSSQTMAIKTDGTLWTWGSSYYGQLGNSSNTSYSSPTQLPGSWTMVSIGKDHVGGVKTDGTLWTWGNGDYGMPGHNNTTTYSSPKQLPGTDWKQFSAADTISGAVKTNGTLWTWGKGAGLAQNTSYPATALSSPKQVGTDTTWDSVTLSGAQGMGFKTDGTFWVWGAGDRGQMGNNDVQSQSSPIQIPGTWVQGVTQDGFGCIGQSTYSGAFKSI